MSGIEKKIDGLGRVVIPIEFRRLMGSSKIQGCWCLAKITLLSYLLRAAIALFAEKKSEKGKSLDFATPVYLKSRQRLKTVINKKRLWISHKRFLRA